MWLMKIVDFATMIIVYIHIYFKYGVPLCKCDITEDSREYELLMKNFVFLLHRDLNPIKPSTASPSS